MNGQGNLLVTSLQRHWTEFGVVRPEGILPQVYSTIFRITEGVF